MSVSQPLVGSLSQSPYGAVHAVTTQRPSEQAAVPCSAAHATPQAPQCALFDWVSVHWLSQHEAPRMHGCVSLHPGTHTLAEQMFPIGQCVSRKHTKHRCMKVSQ